MRIKPKEAKARIRLLTNPEPVAMALVDQGACQTPFNVVKNAKKVTTGKGRNEMSKKLRLKAGKGSKRQPVIQKMQFSKAQFPTEKSVRQYLDKKNVEGFGDIEDGDDIWIVPTTEDLEGKTVGKAKSTPGRDDGVTVFVLEAKSTDDEEDEDEDEDESTSKSDEDGDDEDGDDEDEDDDEEDEEASKRASKVTIVDGKSTKKKVKSKKGDDENSEPVLDLSQKYDWWGAYMSGEQSLTDVLKDGMSYDALPPGMDEVMFALSKAAGNILADTDMSSEDKRSKLATVGSEFGTITMDLFEVFDAAIEDAEKSVDADIRKKAKKFSKNFSEGVSRLRKGLFGNDPATEEDDEDEDSDEPTLKDVLGAVASIGNRISKVEKGVQEFERHQTSKRLDDSFDDLVDDDDEDDESEETRKAAISDAAVAFGGRRSNAL